MEHPVDDFRATARTRAEIEEYIYGRYHDFDIRKIVPSEGGINFHMDIYVGSDVSDKQIARLQKELTEVDFGTDQIQVLRTTEPPEDKTKLNPQDSVMWLNTNKSYPFTVAETDFWYDNIEVIYDGSAKRKDVELQIRDRGPVKPLRHRRGGGAGQLSDHFPRGGRVHQGGTAGI